jgi:hypothetical protein
MRKGKGGNKYGTMKWDMITLRTQCKHAYIKSDTDATDNEGTFTFTETETETET